MASVNGSFQGYIVAKEGAGAKGPWKLYNIIVDGKKWGFGFNAPKAAVGEHVSFETVTNSKGYEEVDTKTFKVSPAQAGAHSAVHGSVSNNSGAPATSGLATPHNDPRQDSIEKQSSISSAARIVAAQINAGVTIASPAQAVASLVDAFLGILHPKPKVQLVQAQRSNAPEDESQDSEDQIPY